MLARGVRLRRVMPLRRRSRVPEQDKASLLVDGVGVLDVRVTFAHQGVADLDVPAEVAASLDGCSARLIAGGGDSVKGTISLGWAPGHVRFTRAGLQRRVHTRVDIKLPALLVPEHFEGMWRAEVRDLSGGGALVADAQTLPLGARLDVQLALADVELWTPARVIRAPAESLRAVRFELLSGEQRARLQRYVLLELIRQRDEQV